MNRVTPGKLGYAQASAAARGEKIDMRALREYRYARVQARYGALLAARAHHAGEPGVPVSLRWSLNPVIGFPRAPFEVWRRTRKEEPTKAVLGAIARAAPATLALPNEAIELRFNAAPGPNGMIVEALSRDGKVLPGQRHVIASSQRRGSARREDQGSSS